MTSTNIQERLEVLRSAIRSENISYGEIAELRDLSKHIDPSDVELLEWAGVPEHEQDIWQMLEAKPPRGCEAVQDLYSWSLNYDSAEGPFTLFIDMIGYSEDEYGEVMYAYPLDSSKLGYMELSKLADALQQYATRPDAVRGYVGALLDAGMRA